MKTIITTALLLSAFAMSCSKPEETVSIIKNERSPEKHLAIVISKPDTVTDTRQTRDTYKEITNNQKPLTAETEISLNKLSNTSDTANFTVPKNKTEIASAILQIINSNQKGQKRPVRVAYFNPADRKPAKNYQARIQKIMSEIQNFYGKGMEQHGFGFKSFDLEMNRNSLIIHYIQSKLPTQKLSRNNFTSQHVYESVSTALKDQGIIADNETVIVFQNLGESNDNSFIDTKAPYYGRWNTNKNRQGFCYVVDSEFLDWQHLTRLNRKIKFNNERTLPLGELASAQIGGVCHELGHAFCLNHTCDSHKISTNSGTALMGYGNWTFKEELRKKSKGTYLSFISAVKLMAHPCFSPKNHSQREFQLVDISLNSMTNMFDLQGKLAATPDVYAVIAYCDNLNQRSDYDATGWVGSVDAMGNFQISINELKANTPYKLTLQFLHVNGDESTEAIEFKTNSSASPILEKGLREKIILKPILQAKLKAGEKTVNKLLRKLEAENNSKSISFLSSNIKLMNIKADKSPAELSEGLTSIFLSQTKWSKAYTGYNSPRNNSIHEDMLSSPWPFLSSRSHIHRFGLYAHANSEYVYDLGKKWKTLTGKYFLKKDMKGSVTFIIKGDGKELFNSGTVTDDQERSYEINIEGIKTIQLIVTDNNNGKNSDWGQWLSTKLKR